MDALVEQPTIHGGMIFPETQRLPDYVSAQTDLHSHQPVLNKEQLHRMYHEGFSGIGKFKKL